MVLSRRIGLSIQALDAGHSKGWKGVGDETYYWRNQGCMKKKDSRVFFDEDFLEPNTDVNERAI